MNVGLFLLIYMALLASLETSLSVLVNDFKLGYISLSVVLGLCKVGILHW